MRLIGQSRAKHLESKGTKSPSEVWSQPSQLVWSEHVPRVANLPESEGRRPYPCCREDLYRVSSKTRIQRLRLNALNKASDRCAWASGRMKTRFETLRTSSRGK